MPTTANGEHKAIWEKAQAYLRCVLSKRSYDLTIAPARLVAVEPERVIVAVPDAQAREWIGGLREPHTIARDLFGCPTMLFVKE